MTDNFYFMRDTHSNYARLIYACSVDDVITTKCILCGAMFHQLKSNLKVYIKGSKEADYYSACGYYIVSEKFQDILVKHNVNGFLLKDLDVLGYYNNLNKEIPFPTIHLKHLVVTCNVGNPLDGKGQIITNCNQCGVIPYDIKHTVKGLNFDFNNWDGSDIFCFNNLDTLPIVTEKLKNIIEQNNLKNIKFQNIKDFVFNI